MSNRARRRWLGSWLALALLALLARAGAAAPFPAASLDSLRQLPRWTLAVQLRLLAVARRATPASARVVQQLLEQPAPAVAPAVRQLLLLHLIDHYFYQQLPGLALLRAHECRQLAVAAADSAGRSRASTVLSYAYSQLRQPALALRYGREAQRYASGPHQANLLVRATDMLSIAAGQLGDTALVWRSELAMQQLTRRQRDSYNEIIGLQNMAQISLAQHRDARARRYLDSASARNDQLDPTDRAGMPLLYAILDAHQGHFRAVATRLQPLLAQARRQHDDSREAEVLTILVPALASLGRYPEAYAGRQRLAALDERQDRQRAQQRAAELAELVAAGQRTRQLEAEKAHATRQQRWLLGLVGSLTVAGLASMATAYRRRLARTHHEQASRQHLAADLHERVGTLLTRVSLLAELLTDAPAAEAAPLLARLQANTRAAARTVRDVVWGLDPQADTAGALADRLREYLHHATEDTPLHTELLTNGLDADLHLTPEIRQLLYLIGQEAIANTVRHARHATRLQVSLCRTGRSLGLRVQDDGQPQPPAPPGARLAAMHRRTTQLGGTLHAGGSSTGFEVSVRVPV